eukprot:s840_g16.t1
MQVVLSAQCQQRLELEVLHRTGHQDTPRNSKIVRGYISRATCHILDRLCISDLPAMTETEEKLRGMGVTMDQRRRLMMASKLGLGPLGQLGMHSEDRSRSPQRQPSPPVSASALVAFAPGGHMVPAQNAEAAKRRLAEQAKTLQTGQTLGALSILPKAITGGN